MYVCVRVGLFLKGMGFGTACILKDMHAFCPFYLFSM